MTLRDYLGRRQYPPTIRPSPPAPSPTHKPPAWDAPGECAWCYEQGAVRPWRLAFRLCPDCRKTWLALALGSSAERRAFLRQVSPALKKRVSAGSVVDIKDQAENIGPSLGGSRALRGGLGP